LKRHYLGIRTAIILKYDEKLIELVEELGYTILSFNRTKEPEKYKQVKENME